MPVYKYKYPTKDGRCWFFRCSYRELDGTRRQYHSKKYLTRKEAQEAEALYLINAKTEANVSNINFKQLVELFVDYKKDKVKETTVYNYGNKIRYIEPLYKVKLKDFDILVYEEWKRFINGNNIATRYKNDIYKFLKSLLNYASEWYNFNFSSVSRKMTNFNDPNELPREMLFFTYDEFQKFLSVEEDLKFRVLYQILYYCGLRIGEAKAITWKDIDFNNKTISINKQIISKNTSRFVYKFSPPKTPKSNRVLSMPNVLINDLLKLKQENQELFIGFNDSFFVSGDNRPLVDSTIRERKNANCRKAGVKQIRIHDFRHSCASLLIHKGASINIVAKYLGHTKIEETLNTYSHLYTNALSDITNLINEMQES